MPVSLAFVWFAYRGDTLPLIESIRSVKELYPDAFLLVMDDIHDRMSRRMVKYLERMGVCVSYTKAPRNGALHSWQCAREMADVYAWCVRETGGGIVCKTDPDTIWLQKGFLEVLADSPCVFGGAMSRCGRGIQGFAYALKPDAVAVLRASYMNDMESPYRVDEDFEVSLRLLRANNMAGTDYMLQMRTSHLGMSPIYPDAGAGFYDWAQDTFAWRERMRRHWSIVTFAPRHDDPYGKALAMRRLRTGR